jgi:ribonucleotide reductase alpha subunit
MTDFAQMEDMRVTKRDGSTEIVAFDKILTRIKRIGKEVHLKINYTSLAMKVIDQLYDTISTTKIDELTAEQCASLASTHPDYNAMAGRILVSNHHKNTRGSFSETMLALYRVTDQHGEHSPMVSHELIAFVEKNADELNALCDYDRDYLIDYFGIRTLERAYLMRIGGKIVERPQHMWLRVSIGIHGDNMARIRETYDSMSRKYFTHATPTLFNSGTLRPQMSSCFLLKMENDSIDGIYNTLKDCAMISKWAGGIGLHIHNVRASGSYIRGTGGTSNGIVPMLRVFNNTAKYVDQGGGKRNGSFAIYLEPWHADIEFFLQMRKNHGDEEMKARDLFYALWVPDLFMERVKTGGTWTLMCPDECPGLADVYGDAFRTLYTSYESAGKGRKTMPARDLWFQILDAQMETGTPYLLYKDAANQKSNQKNIGVIKSSNLCVAPETLILTDKGHLPIESLTDQTVNVWNGQMFSEVVVRKTGTDQQLIEIHTNDGSSLTCTPYHKFYVYSSSAPNEVVVKEARQLRLDDTLLEGGFPSIRNGAEEATSEWMKGNAYTHGVYSGNGTYSQETAKVPLQQDLAIRLEWFAGLFDVAGELFYDTNASPNPFLQIVSIHEGFLKKIKYMLQTCGVNPHVHRVPTTEPKYYARKSMYRLLLLPLDVEKLCLVGFSPKQHTIPVPKTLSANRMVTVPIRVSKIIDNGRVDDTYCFSEPKQHMGVFNGMLTGQCTEIMEVSTEEETAVCNLASIGLPMFVETSDADTAPTFNHAKLHEIARMVTYNLNQIIDVNFYPTEKTRRSNMRHRPIGIGVQGLADVFMLMDLPFMSNGAKDINREIFETIYHGALEESCALAKQYGAYETFVGSPASEGILQFDMWGVVPESGRYDWTSLKADIQQYGLRNSLLLAPMPTASTSQILGYNECIEPITSNIYSRRTLAGEFIMANKYLMHDLLRLDLWNDKIKNNIIANNGSVQQIDMIPVHIREKYRTVWEIPMRHLIDMASDRGAYICQSQSLNLWQEDPNYNTLTSMHFYSWSKGLKTGIYYLRRRGKHQAQQFTIEPEKKTDGKETVYEDDHEICEMCSS